ncbi:MAG: hypothetical protein WED10_14870 [Brumimicrobium sp.]
MNKQIEHIIKNNQFFELDNKQKEIIADWASNSEEFDAIKTTLLASEEFATSNKQELNETIKQRLDVKFAEKYNKTRLAWYNQLGHFFWPADAPSYKKPLIQFLSIAIIVVLAVQFIPNPTKQQLAVNETPLKKESQKKDKTKSEEEVKSEDLVDKPEEKSEGLDTPQEDIEEPLKENRNKSDRIHDDKASLQENDKSSGWRLSDQDRVENEVREEAEETVLPTADDLDNSQDEMSMAEQEALRSVSKKSLKDSSSRNDVKARKVLTLETLDLVTALY